MGSTLSFEQLNSLRELKKKGAKIIVAGGCFDILHTGHVEFLKRAKGLGGILVVLLENDKKIKELKGEARPIHTQTSRALNLLTISEVDYVLPLSYLATDRDYEILVKTIQPDIIAVTNKDPLFPWEKEYKKTGGLRIVKVMDREEKYSTSKIIEDANK